VRVREGGLRAVVAATSIARARGTTPRQQPVAELAGELEREMGGVDVLVNNAGVLLDEDTPILDLPMETARETFETNLFGALATCQAFVPGMMRRRYGRVVNVSSGAGLLGPMQGYAPAYSMSKTALNALTRQMAFAARGRNVLVNAVDPGWVRTDMGGSGAPRSVEKGADTIVFLATLPDGSPTGGFFHDRKQIPW
jgi:NAD(P)-dependent dehydrogenase (short-subunit alcohol dehydrogenase family)